MRAYERPVGGQYYRIECPPRIVFAYNYNAVILKSMDETAFKYTITVQDDSATQEARTIEAASYKGQAQADISLLFQLLFDTQQISKRSVKSTVTVRRDGEFIISFSCLVLYSAMNIGDRLQNYGAYPNPNAEHYERHITWFAQFPFVYSYLAIQGATVFVRKDNEQYGEGVVVTANQEGIQDDSINSENIRDKFVMKIKQGESTSTFDDSFDYTFFRLGKSDSLLIFERSDAKCGYYFRWIDKRGFWMQYLFDKGTFEHKTELGEVSKEYYNEINDILFNTQRVTSIDATNTLRCCATNLDKERYEDVASIASACYVDIFLGYNDKGEALWKPCNVSSASHTRNEQKEFNDFEIAVKFIEITQRL